MFTVIIMAQRESFSFGVLNYKQEQQASICASSKNKHNSNRNYVRVCGG